MKTISFIDSEIGLKDKKIHDLGAINFNNQELHTKDVKVFAKFVSRSNYICGHNIINHDYKYLKDYLNSLFNHPVIIDTLPISPLLFPKKPYHNLLKDDKIISNELNNPLSDAKKCKILFDNEVSTFNNLDEKLKRIYYGLTGKNEYYKGFFDYLGYSINNINLEREIFSYFDNKICANSNVAGLIKSYPLELAYALASISTDDKESIIPFWVKRNYPLVEKVMDLLRNKPCKDNCPYCSNHLNAKIRLKDFFGYDDFRTFNGEPLQENAVKAAINGDSILTIFPTGGGKSITFQLPALISGIASKSLTIVISPLQSLMKDQVDNLSNKGIIDSVTINGLLSPIERKEAIERVMNGVASLLYISPETLRSKTLERILLCRNIERVVIDEAHCFSSWGQDFRVDYLYIAEFIKKLEELKGNDKKIPVSCFTATAKPKVISDIKEYFSQNLGRELTLFATKETRKNLSYHVIKVENDEEKYQRLRDLIIKKECPTIIYVSRVAKTKLLAQKLCADGFKALAYNGQMEPKEKQVNQESFKNNETQIMVATSAFGMGVDKDDVGLVIHYDISDSLENYVQESGRAGRNQNLDADCYVLYNDDDLDSHFLLLNQTKLSIADIRQVFKAIKNMTKIRPVVYCSALEIARQAGWDDSIHDIETRVRTAISALENAGYIHRGQNSPRVFATSINASSYVEAENMINKAGNIFDDKEIILAKRIVKALIGAKNRFNPTIEEAESRIEYLADTLGIEKMEVISCVDKLKEINILKDENDLTAYIKKTDTANKTDNVVTRFYKLEKYMVENLIIGEPLRFDVKRFINQAFDDGLKDATEKNVKTILYLWKLNEFIKKESSTISREITIEPIKTKVEIEEQIEKRNNIVIETVNHLYSKAKYTQNKDEDLITFSMKEVIDNYNNSIGALYNIDNKDMQMALLYLNKIDALTLEGGFLVLYNAMQIEKLVDNKTSYTQENYKKLKEYYNLKIQQIHIVGNYANMMCKDINEALVYVQDYFNMDYDLFIRKYFKTRMNEIKKNITASKYNKIFGVLSPIQRNIIDDESQYITVLAGPGSGKTMVLVHKLASLLLLEDVKAEQLLMLTFSRSAATEFKLRLHKLIGNAASYVDIKTFHSYCFDLLGKLGSEEEFDNVVPTAIEMIKNDEIEVEKINKAVLVIDEAQDMDKNEYQLILELIKYNEDMRVIIVGDDDQNIYEFRGSNSRYMQDFMEKYKAKRYEMIDNYRSINKIVLFSNIAARFIKNRLKESSIVAIRKDDGIVSITKHTSENMEESIIESLKSNKTLGNIAILTKTNDEALNIVGLLLKNKINATLIQDDTDFRFNSLLEVKHLLYLFNKNSDSPIITEEEWKDAREEIYQKYFRSIHKDVILNMMKKFELTYKAKYKTDFEEFVSESKYEDFVDIKTNKIVVSTIHKSKGKEFDTVYLMLNNYSIEKDEKARDLYVAITRAKTNLFVNYHGTLFDQFKNYKFVNYKYDFNVYEESKELTINLSHRDVFLGYFKSDAIQKKIKEVISGDELKVTEYGLSLKKENYSIVSYSKAFQSKLNDLKEKGFVIDKVIAKYVVLWKDKEEIDGKEYRIVLPSISLKKEELVEEVIEVKEEVVEEDKIEIEEIKEEVKEEKVEIKEKDNSLDDEKKLIKDGFDLVYDGSKCLTDLKLLKRLRRLRVILAKNANQPAFWVVSNKTLVYLATYKPKNEKEILNIYGFGSAKYEKHGKDFLDEINKTE